MNTCKLATLLLFFFLSCAPAPKEVKEEAPSDSESVTAIKLARKLSNLAIRNRDTVGVTAVLMDNFQIITSRDNEVRGMEANKESFANIFQTDAQYTRTPNKIDVMEKWGMASEYGNWAGTLTVDEEQIEIGGTYYAKWHQVDGEWLLRTEVFTPIYCRGGAYCNNRPSNP